MSRDLQKPPVPWSWFDATITIVAGLGVLIIAILIYAGQ